MNLYLFIFSEQISEHISRVFTIYVDILLTEKLKIVLHANKACLLTWSMFKNLILSLLGFPDYTVVELIEE